MNEDILKGKWHELKGGVKAKWGKLTDDEIATLDGKAEQLQGLLQAKYGYTKDKAAKEYNDFFSRKK